MANAQITVPLTTLERRSLLRIAQIECREPSEQLRFLLRRDAQERGLLASPSSGLKEKAAFKSDGQTRDDQDTALSSVS